MSLSRTRLLRLTLLVGVPLIVVIGSVVVWQQGGRVVNTENAYVKADIAQIAPQVSGRVIDVAVRDNARVSAGQALVRIDRKSVV